jgi:hypothetical protein
MTAKASIKSIQKSLVDFYQDPAYTTFFFGAKLAGEWANSSFESLAFQDAHLDTIKQGAFVQSALEPGGKINSVLLLWFDLMHAVILFGVLMYLISAKNATVSQLFFVILFIGGFIFFTFWEAKATYVVPYFFLLIPYAYPGYLQCADSTTTLVSVMQRKVPKTTLREFKSIYVTILILTILIFIIAISDSQYINNLFKITFDTEQYYEYMSGLIKSSWRIIY